jgi:hypothetical protein
LTETSVSDRLAGTDLMSPWSGIARPADVNQNGQWDSSEIELWQARQDSGRLAWLLMMMARAEVARLRSEGGSTVAAEKSLRQAHQSFEQGDFSRAMAVAGRADGQARRARERLRSREDLEETDDDDREPRLEGPEDKESDQVEDQDQTLDRISLEELRGLMNLAQRVSQELAGRPPPEYVEIQV